MLTCYSDTSGVPEYTNILEGAQKKSHRAQLSINDLTLMYIAMKLILQDQDFTSDIKEWEKKRPTNKTWLM